MTRPPEAVLALWDIAAPLQRLTGGHRNAAWRGGDLVLKSTRRSEAALVWLGPMMQAAEAAGFAVPRLIPSRQGRLVEAGWTCEPYLEGQPFAPADLARIAGRIADLHQRSAALPQRPGFAGALDLAAGADSGGDVDLAAMPAPLAAACRNALAALRGLPQAGIHGDLGPGNLLWTAGGRSALLDWDEARQDAAVFDTGPCGADLAPPLRRALLAWEIACCWQPEPERAAALAAGFMAVDAGRGAVSRAP